MPALDRAKTILAAEKHARAGKFLEAVAEYRKIAEDNPRDMNVLNKLGDLLGRAGKNQEALRCYLRIAEFYAKDGFFLKAIAMYKKISKLDPSNLDSQQQLAGLYQRQGLASEAKAQFLLVAEQLMRKGQSQPATEMLQKVLEIEPDNVKVRTTLAELLGRAAKGDGAAREYCQVARAAIDRGAAGESLQALRKAIHADAAYHELPGVLVALVTKIETTPKDLAPLAEEVVRAAPRSGIAVVAVAESYRRAGRKAEAEAAFKRLEGSASGLQDLNGEAMALVARWHTSAGRDAQAFEWLNRAVESFLLEARCAEAAAALDAYLQRHPVHRQALSARAAVAVRGEDPEGEAAALLRLAPLLIEALEHDRAVEVVERLGKLRPGDQAVFDLQVRLQGPATAPAPEPEEEPAAPASPAEEEARSAEELFVIEEDSAPEGAVAEPEIEVASDVTPEDPEVPPEEAAYGPVSKIQEIQAADVDGQPIDEEFISEHLTEAEVFVKYGLLAKAREQLLAILERYPKDQAAHQRLIEVHLGEGNSDLAVKECLLLADLKRAEGLDGEARELVNEAIRIAGPGSPLVERYAKELESRGAPKTSVHKEPEAKRPREVGRSQEARATPPEATGPRAVASRAGGQRPDSRAASERRPAPASVPKRKETPTEELEIEIEMPEDEGTRAPAAAPVADFAVSTLRSKLIRQPGRVEEETPDDLPGRGAAAGATDPEEQIEMDEPEARESGSALSSLPQSASREPDGEKLGEVDFYMEQGLTDEARQVLFQLSKQYPGSRSVVERLHRLESPPGAATPKASDASPEANLDFEVEQALGGRAVAPPEPPKKDSKKDPPKPPSRPAKARPVFKVEAHQPPREGDYFDLAKELDSSLADGTERRGAVVPDSLEGPGHSFDEVLAAFRKGVEQQVDQEDYDTHYNLGIAYKEMGLVDEAIGEFQFAARDPSRTLECCGILGLCFRDRGMPDLALKWYRRGLDMPGLDEQKTIGLRYDMAEVYREKGEYQQALRMYTEVYGVDSNYRDVSARIKEVKGLLASSSRR